MCDQVSPYLQLDSEAMNKTLLLRILTQTGELDGSKILQSVKEKATTAGDKYSAIWSKIQWGRGSIKDSMTALYTITGGQHIRHPGQTGTTYPNGQRVPQTKLHETIHPSVHHRTQVQPGYEPKGLHKEAGWVFNEGTDGNGRRWINFAKGVEGLTVMEYAIPSMILPGPLNSLERKFAPADLLQKIDKASEAHTTWT